MIGEIHREMTETEVALWKALMYTNPKSMEQLKKETGQTRYSLLKMLHVLQDEGWVQWCIKKTKGRGGRTLMYTACKERLITPQPRFRKKSEKPVANGVGSEFSSSMEKLWARISRENEKLVELQRRTSEQAKLVGNLRKQLKEML